MLATGPNVGPGPWREWVVGPKGPEEPLTCMPPAAAHHVQAQSKGPTHKSCTEIGGIHPLGPVPCFIDMDYSIYGRRVQLLDHTVCSPSL
jgi:hypothetical protein